MTTNTKPAKDLKALAAKISGIKDQIAELEQQLNEIDYVEYGAYPVGAIVKVLSGFKPRKGWVKKVDFRATNQLGFAYKTEFVYEIGALKRDGTPAKNGIIEYFAKHEDLEVMEDDN